MQQQSAIAWDRQKEGRCRRVAGKKVFRLVKILSGRANPFISNQSSLRPERSTNLQQGWTYPPGKNFHICIKLKNLPSFLDAVASLAPSKASCTAIPALQEF